ncbi:MAG: tetratricopeptide repeat protein [Thermoplasmata archaeon]
MAFDLIQKPLGTMNILMYLSRKGAADVTTIIEETEICNKTFYKAINRLKSLGLVFEETKKGWPTHVIYQLTYKGEEAVKHLYPLEEIILGSVEGQWEELGRLESEEKSQENMKRMLELLRNLQEATFDLGEWDKTLRLSERAIGIASAVRDESSLSHAYRYAGLVHQKRNDFHKTKENLRRSIEISTRTEEWDGAAEDHYVLGALYERRGDLQDALAQYEKSLEFARRAEWMIGEARARLGFGRVLGKRGKSRQSLEEIQRAVKDFEDLGAVDELARAYGNLGATIFDIDADKALEFYEKSIEIARKTGEVRILAIGLSNASGCYANEGDKKKALDYLKEAEDIISRLNDPHLLVSVRIHLGCVYWSQQDWKKSERYFKKAIDICDKESAKYEMGDALFHYGLMLSDKGDTERSESILGKALAIFDEIGSAKKIAKTKKALDGLTR